MAVKSLGSPKPSSSLTDTERIAFAAEGRSTGYGPAAKAAAGDAAAVKKISEAARADAEKKQQQADAAAGSAAFRRCCVYEQCYITSILKELVDKRFEPDEALPLPYINKSGNKPICSKGSGFGYINSLAVSKNQKALFGLREKRPFSNSSGYKII